MVPDKSGKDFITHSATVAQSLSGTCTGDEIAVNPRNRLTVRSTQKTFFHSGIHNLHYRSYIVILFYNH